MTFNWSAETRSLIIGSFYYGYAVSQIPGGLLSMYWKSQHVFGLTVSLSGLLCALMPLVAAWNVDMLITCRFLMGFIQVCHVSGQRSMNIEWSWERTRTQKGRTLI